MSLALRLLPRTIAGQIAGIILVALLLAQGLTVGYYFLQRQEREPAASPLAATARIGAIVGLADLLPPGARKEALAAAGGPHLSVALAAEPAVRADFGGGFASERLRRFIRAAIGDPARPVLVDRPIVEIEPDQRLRIAVALSDGQWLVFAIDPPPAGPPRRGFLHGSGFAVSIVFLVVSIALLSIWATRRVTAPLSRLAAAADKLGTEGSAPALAERGPAELRRAARAFNLMQERLKRFVDDRTRMLAAISHDLRTPLTRLRLRAEAAGESEDRRKMLSDIAAMDAMVGSALAFLRGDEAGEAVEIIDLPSLLLTLCDEFTDMGLAASYSGPERHAIRGRPRALTRAFTNLVDNAVKFGREARITLSTPRAGETVVEIADDGPGIPDVEKDRAFEPFTRLDPARGGEQAGTGLGLTIARTIIHAHGGEIRLVDREPNGLVVRVSLPGETSAASPSLRNSPQNPS